MDVEIRHIDSREDYAACVALQKETWGQDFKDAVPGSILMVSQRVGGVTAGAFDANGEMVGCVYGLTGYKDGRPVHWSDILAVKRRARGHGIGKRLKLFQRGELLKRGIETMYWTYDPLQALNANLNFNALAARPVEYVVDMYGETGSDLHSGLGTDRFIVQWDMASDRVERTLAGTTRQAPPDATTAPIVNSNGASTRPQPFEGELLDVALVRVEVPASIDDTKRESDEIGARWRACTRRAFTHYLDNGYNASQFMRDGRGRYFYVLSARDIEDDDAER